MTRRVSAEEQGVTSTAEDPQIYLDQLRAQRTELDRVSTADRTAHLLREQITTGLLPPGERLSEELIGAALGVSRNTLREAFRLLSHERLLVHVLNRGVFVRELNATDVIEIYRMRTLLECGVIREFTEAPPGIEAAEAAVREGEKALKDKRWKDMGTADVRFHQALVALSGSPRVEEVTRGVLAELRLAFHVMADPAAFHKPYLPRNRQIVEQLQQGKGAKAADTLTVYLRDARDQLLEQFEEKG